MIFSTTVIPISQKSKLKLRQLRSVPKVIQLVDEITGFEPRKSGSRTYDPYNHTLQHPSAVNRDHNACIVRFS